MTIRSSWIRRTGRALKSAAGNMIGPDTPKDAAAISYFSLIALFPSVLVMIAVLHPLLERPELRSTLIQSVAGIFPGSRTFLKSNLEEILDPSPAIVLSCAGVVLWSTSWIFFFVENAFNKAWGVPRRRSFWESRTRSISLMIAGCLLLLVSSVLTIIVNGLRQGTASIPAFAHDPIINGLWSLILRLAGILISLAVFTLIYKLLPDRHVKWVEALSGGTLAAAIWEVGSTLFVEMTPHFDYKRVYGQTGAIVLLLAWVYTSNLIVLFGAHFSAQLHRSDETDAPGSAEAPAPTQAASGARSNLHRLPHN